MRAIFILAMTALFAAPAARAQMLVDPTKVAPEQRSLDAAFGADQFDEIGLAEELRPAHKAMVLFLLTARCSAICAFSVRQLVRP